MAETRASAAKMGGESCLAICLLVLALGGLPCRMYVRLELPAKPMRNLRRCNEESGRVPATSTKRQGNVVHNGATITTKNEHMDRRRPPLP